jgi:demethylmenaquinone methyltransferase/2-methoxy-6-polyprenyl-1,4-benzoquinol methylase
MFGAIARRYDLANHILSSGCDFYWRRRAAEIVAGWRPNKVLDLATGTGDLALVLQKRVHGAEIVGADFSEEMLAIAREKGIAKTQLADIAALPFTAESFDCVTIAFGLRNLADWSTGLREMARILRASGHVLILDFSLPENPILRAIYRFYLHSCVPLIAAAVTRNREAYEYLGGSIEQFPSGGEMVRLIETNGFSTAHAYPLTGGIVTIYTAIKRANGTSDRVPQGAAISGSPAKLNGGWKAAAP